MGYHPGKHYGSPRRWSDFNPRIVRLKNDPVSHTNAQGMNNSAKRRLHRTRREGDEIACSCGKRWPLGEQHP